MEQERRDWQGQACGEISTVVVIILLLFSTQLKGRYVVLVLFMTMIVTVWLPWVSGMFIISQHSFCIYYNDYTRFVVYTLVCIDLDFPIVNEVFRDNDRVQISCTMTVPWTILSIDWNPTPALIGGVNSPIVIDNFTRRTSRISDLELSNCVEYGCVVAAGRLHSNHVVNPSYSCDPC